MKFERYAKRRDTQVLLESAGTNKVDLRAASRSMREWLVSTCNMLEAIAKVPEITEQLGGASFSSNSLGERSLADELTLEFQRVKCILQEIGLDDLMSRINQHSARIEAASEQLM